VISEAGETRKHINLREKLAATLALLLSQSLRDDMRERKVVADSVISLFDFDHAVLHVHGGTDTWDNLTPMLRKDHREKSKDDIKKVAKSRRIARAPEKWRGLLAPKTRDPKRPSRWPKRKLRSKPINARWRRKRSGNWRHRK
jgi:5-methylcytosine-specific restriction endonuclease McrA